MSDIMMIMMIWSWVIINIQKLHKGVWKKTHGFLFFQKNHKQVLKHEEPTFKHLMCLFI
jgi:hypothetical protein